MMTSAAPTKFRFDLDLGHRAERNAVMTETAIATLVANAREEGRREGLAEGQRDASVKAAQAIANEHAAIQDESRELRAQLEAVTNSATTVARLVKIWPEVVEFLPDAAQRVGECAIVPVELINRINAKIGVSAPKRLDGVSENPFE